MWLWNRLVELGAQSRGSGRRRYPAPGGRPSPVRPRDGQRPRWQRDPHLRRAPGQVCRELLRPEGRFHRPRGACKAVTRPLSRYMDRDFSDMDVLPRTHRAHRPAGSGRNACRHGNLPRTTELVGWVTSGTMVPLLQAARARAWQPSYPDEASGKRCHRHVLYRQRRAGGRHGGGGRARQAAQGSYTSARHMSVDAPPFARPHHLRL